MRLTILVVEDDHALRDVLVRGLRDEGFDTVAAQDGAIALRLVGEGVDAVVLDVGLPDADGRDVCQAMRAQGFLGPVVFLTAHHRLSDRLSGFSAGVTTTFPSPSTSPNSPPDCAPPSNVPGPGRPRLPGTWSSIRCTTVWRCGASKWC